jgi:hypothetical protein
MPGSKWFSAGSSSVFKDKTEFWAKAGNIMPSVKTTDLMSCMKNPFFLPSKLGKELAEIPTGTLGHARSKKQKADLPPAS